MPMVRRSNEKDPVVDVLREALAHYEQAYPGAQSEIDRQNPGAVRIRIVDDRFAQLSRAQRHDDVWGFLTEHVTDRDALGEVSMLLLLTPQEKSTSLSNAEFERPTRSMF